MHTSSKLIRRAGVPALFAAAAAASNAQFATTFDSVNGYSIGNLIGVDDPALSGTTVWTATYAGGPGSVTISNANPASGDQHFRLQKTTAQAATGGTLNLGASAIPSLSAAFTVSFDFAVGSDWSAGTANQGQILFGGTQSNLGNQPYWFALFFTEGTLQFYTASGGTGAGTFAVSLGNYTTYSPYGGYIGVSMTIDPLTRKFTSVSLTGTTSGLVDKTSTVLGSPSAGTLPIGTSATPAGSVALDSIPANLNILSGGNDGITIDIDNFSISAVPEPSAAAALAGVAALTVVGRRRRVRS